MPCSKTPAEPTRPRLWRSRQCCPRATQAEGLSGYIISRLTQGFSFRCLRFTSDVTAAHARLASGWRAAPLPGGCRTLWVASKGFRLHSILLSRTSPVARAVLSKLQSTKPSIYSNARIQRDPDLIIPGQWALEIKIARPFGDNGLLAEHWSENLLHPYPGNTSSLGDCVKLLGLRVSESKAVVIIGYEHTPARVPLDPAIRGFEMLAKEIMRLRLSPRVEELRVSLVHPVHQQLRVFAYEVLGTMATR